MNRIIADRDDRARLRKADAAFTISIGSSELTILAKQARVLSLQIPRPAIVGLSVILPGRAHESSLESYEQTPTKTSPTPTAADH